MGLINEPKEVDFTVKSEPWTEKELADFRKLMKKQKLALAKKKFLFKNENKKHQAQQSISVL